MCNSYINKPVKQETSSAEITDTQEKTDDLI